jgi:hypothetical protein
MKRMPVSIVCLLLASATACSGSSTEETGIVQEAYNNVGSSSPLYDVGVRCQSDYQNAWQPTWNNNGMCNNFISAIGAGTWTIFGNQFYYNLHGAANAIQAPSDSCFACGGADSVDFFLMQEHGGYNATNAFWPMWDQNSWVNSTSMSLGDNGLPASILASYSCSTMYTADGNFWNRWGHTFVGGVKVILGAHDLVWDGNDQKGTEFGNRIGGGEAIGQSWLEAVWYADNDNHPSVAATGTSSSNCNFRQGLTTWNVDNQNGAGPALTSPSNVCWTGWNGS